MFFFLSALFAILIFNTTGMYTFICVLLTFGFIGLGVVDLFNPPG